VQSKNKRQAKPKTELNAESKKVDRSWYAGGHDFLSLAEKLPLVAQQWHKSKNGEWQASDFACGSDVVVWWHCAEGPDHQWQSAIYSRLAGKGCPFCANKKVSITNSLVLLFPDLAQEWQTELNGDLLAGEVTTGSRKKVWWQCKKNSEHLWQAEVCRRVGGSGCPYCTHFKASKETSLATLFPAVAAQLHPAKNGDLKAEQLTAKSHKKVWWQCDHFPDHHWQATVANRTGNGSNCPSCATRNSSAKR